MSEFNPTLTRGAAGGRSDGLRESRDILFAYFLNHHHNDGSRCGFICRCTSGWGWIVAESIGEKVHKRLLKELQ